MGTATVTEQLEILRRIAERGRKVALDHVGKGGTCYLDLFQHLLDEIERTKKYNDVS